MNTQLITLLQSYVNGKKDDGVTDYIPDSIFQRVQGLQIGNRSLVDSNAEEAKFFGSDPTGKTEVIISQFNHDDVVKLFDINSDGEITDADKGINVTYGDANGYLGQSFQAFIQAAYTWASTNSSFDSVAYKDMLKIQNNVNLKDTDANYEKLHQLVVNTYSRPLNDAFGKDLAGNYKESVKVK